MNDTASSSCITSVVRVKYVTTYAPTADLSWDTVQVVAWSVIEVLSGVICINLPPCRQLLGKLFPRQTHTTRGAITTHTSMSQKYGTSRRPYTGHADSLNTVTTVISTGDVLEGSDHGKSSPWMSMMKSPMVSTRQNARLNQNENDGASEKVYIGVDRSYLELEEDTADEDVDQSKLGVQDLEVGKR